MEQVGGLSERYRRSSLGLKTWLRQVAVELGGRAGERLCRRMHLAAGRTRLLELLVPPPVPERAPRVLGVDEFAFRRGRTYGTILVDVEAGQVVAALPATTTGGLHMRPPLHHPTLHALTDLSVLPFGPLTGICPDIALRRRSAGPASRRMRSGTGSTAS
ncbi:hypothetical protein [Streptomyces sp. NPDC059918]|uniref:hypothetical protein n=1 Tax=unclassified Streptomyces TaxID=2593676 RepID=UPI0036579F0A